MIFKKTALQGNFILASGVQIIFTDNHYETEDESEIAQLSAVYETVDELPAKESSDSPAPEKSPSTVGTANSATLANILKK